MAHTIYALEVTAIKISISTASGHPLYEQIAGQIRLQVLRGQLCDGDQLPSIRALSRELRVSIVTTKRAYEELEREGLLSVSAGRGSFVRAQGIAGSVRLQMEELEAQMQATAGLAKVLGLTQAQFVQLATNEYEEQDR